MDYQENLKNFMSQNGLPISDDILFDGEVHRFSSRDSSDRDEWYVIKEVAEGKYHCTFASWRMEESKKVWRSYKENELPDELERLETINHKIREFQEKDREKALKNLNVLWNNAKSCLEHDYIEKKKIQNYDLRIDDKKLLIPLYDINRKRKSLLRILPDGHKRYFPKLSTAGLFYPFGDYEKTSEIIFCEGFATGASIFEATEIPTLSCGGASNICMVAQAIKQLYPQKALTLAYDNDKAGKKVAEDWKKYFNDNIYCPPEEGQDFNDLAVSKGLEGINEIIIEEVEVSSIQEILEMKIQPQKKYNKILAEGTINVLFAAPKVGKSRFAYEMAYCVASGHTFLKFPTEKKAKTLYIDGELSDWDLQVRLDEMIERFFKKDENEKPVGKDKMGIIKYANFVKKLKTSPNLLLPSHQRFVEKRIEQNEIIIFDSYGCLTQKREGESPRFDELDWKKFFLWLRGFKEKGKCILIIMHCNKSEQLAGTGVIRNDVDNLYKLEKPFDIDTTSKIHFDFKYDDCRTIPLFEREEFSARIVNNDSAVKTCGWAIDTIQTKADRYVKF